VATRNARESMEEQASALNSAWAKVMK